MSTRALLALAVLCHGISGQEILWQRVGNCASEALWFPAVFLNDLDGDGHDDIACLAWVPNPPPPWAGKLPTVLIVSGKAGKTIRQFVYNDPNYQYEALVGCGDVDGDGKHDYAVMRRLSFNPVLNHVDVQSGADDHVIWSVSGPWGDDFGLEMVGDIDLNGDQRPDLLIGARRELQWAGAAYGYDHTGARLFRLGLVTGFVTLGRIGDYDRDGADDFLLGGYEPGLRGAAYVHSGRTQQVLAVGYGEYVGDGLGSGFVLGVGDVDADGVLDFAGSSIGGFGGPGVVRVFSGKTTQALFSWRDTVLSGFGDQMAAGDLDQDGIADLLVSSPDPSRALASIAWYSLRDGSLVTYLSPPGGVVGTYFPYMFSVGRAQPGNAFPTIMAPERSYRGCTSSFSWAGRLNLYRAAPANVRPLGTACTGTLPAAPGIGYRAEGSAARIHLTGASPGANAALLVGLSSTSWAGTPLPLRLDPLGFPGCSLFTSIDAVATVAAGTSGTALGYGYFDVPILAAPLFGQWLVAGSGATWPGGFSAGLRW